MLELLNINNKFSMFFQSQSDIPNKFVFRKNYFKNINNKFELRKLNLYNIQNDFRMFTPEMILPEVGIQALGKTYFKIKINSIDITDLLYVNIDSLRFKEVLNDASEADFNLILPYDSTSKPILGQIVEVLFNNKRKFYGYITSITKNDNPESISIHAEGEYDKLNKELVNFYIGRKENEEITETYYTTYKDALSALGLTTTIGNFVPTLESYIESGKIDAISAILSKCGSFGFFIKADGSKNIPQGGKGSIVYLDRQELGQNLSIYNILSHNFTESELEKIDKVKVIMGDSIVVGYDSTFRDVRLYNFFKEKAEDDPTVYHHTYFKDAGWIDGRKSSDNVSKIVVWNEWSITVPAGYHGFEFYGEFIIEPTPPGVYTFQTSAYADENIQNVNSLLYFYNYGEVKAERRKSNLFYVGIGDKERILNLSNLNCQIGANYRVISSITPNSYQMTIKSNEIVFLYIFIKDSWIRIPSWDDTLYATDLADWEYSKYKDTKIMGNISITIDCADLYDIDLSKRIMIPGILDNPLNIKSIEYDAGNYVVNLTLESENYFERTVSIPTHL